MSDVVAVGRTVFVSRKTLRSGYQFVDEKTLTAMVVPPPPKKRSR